MTSPFDRLRDALPLLPDANFSSWHSKASISAGNPSGACNAFNYPPQVRRDEAYWVERGYHAESLFTADQMRDYARAALAAADAELAARQEPEPIQCWCCGSPNWPIGSGGIEHAGALEPAAWFDRMSELHDARFTHWGPRPPAFGGHWTPLYAAPVAAQTGLTGLTPIGDLVQMPDGAVMHKDDAGRAPSFADIAGD